VLGGRRVQADWRMSLVIRVECMFLSNTTLFYLMVEVYLHYCLRYNYMFRLLTIAIFRLYMNP